MSFVAFPSDPVIKAQSSLSQQTTPDFCKTGTTMPPMTLSTMSWMLLSCLMFLSRVEGEGEVSQKKLPSSRITCPQGSVAYGSYCYSLILIPQTWSDAEGTLPNGSGWKWSSSNMLTFYNWERNPSVAADRGYCAALSRNSGYQMWRDYNCEVLLPYVCKFKA
ncbi:regenerating islet-derived 3 delta [Cricetulus griseus]